ncbi:acyl carrier protein [Phycisphaerales bacterium AB-hyl4]|uniref:Acyl carrier protein n=1 Tax=Natronomicrosphaera hydrolytica TaxID=3242702 RepID=A0ABV4U2B4_9BACT
MPMTQDEVFSKVQDVLEDALGVDDDEVTPEAKLVEDLGAESIDFLDIVFRLEKAFGIKIEQSELFPENVLNDPQYVQDGEVTDEGMAELRKRLPHVDLSEFESSRKVEDFSNVFTVDAIVKFVQSKLS